MAMNAFMTSQSLAPASSVMWCGLGMAAATTSTSKKSKEKGYSAYQCAMEFFPHFQAKVGFGLTAMDMGRVDVAMIALQRAYDENPSNIDVVNALGVISAHYKLYNYSINLFQKVLVQLKGSNNDDDVQIFSNIVNENIQRVKDSQEEQQEGKQELKISLSNWKNCQNNMNEEPQLIILQLLKLTEIHWWNKRNPVNNGSYQSTLNANLYSNLWLDLSILLSSSSSTYYNYSLSCARFSVCLASHGTTEMSTKTLLHLGELLMNDVKNNDDNNDGGGETKNKETLNTDITIATAAPASIVFKELNEGRPRWINLPLSYRSSCTCSKTSKEAAIRAVKENPASTIAWEKLKNWS
jgi:hypothetical protein